MTSVDVVIIGGGISGLTAARVLGRHGHDVRLLEREPGCGGVIHTDRVDEYVIDAGPDTLLAHKPAAIALAHELGLTERLVKPLPDRTTYVVRRGALRRLPETSAMGLPTSWQTLLKANAFSLPGKVRMAAEALLPPRPPAEGDESISSFVRRRFGHEAVKYVAEPLLAGLHRGDAARLSLRALFPVLADAETRHGSVARAWRKMSTNRVGGSLSLRTGLAELVAEMSAQLPPGTALTGSEAIAVESHGRDYVVCLRGGSRIAARAVLLATPAHVTTTLSRSLDAELANLCAGVRFVSAVNVALAYAAGAVAHPMRGWGFVVPASEKRRARSVSWVSSKWPGRAPDGSVLIRVSLGGSSDAEAIAASDAELVTWAHDDLRDLMGIRGTPTLTRVYRLPLAMPQLEIGHLSRMAAIERRLAALPGLFLTASGFRGVGLPDCIKDAQATAEQLSAYLHLTARAAARDGSAIRL